MVLASELSMSSQASVFGTSANWCFFTVRIDPQAIETIRKCLIVFLHPHVEGALEVKDPADQCDARFPRGGRFRGKNAFVVGITSAVALGPA